MMSMGFYKDLFGLKKKIRRGKREERCPNLDILHVISDLFCQDHVDYITSNKS